jgi:hypothetical protein
MRYDGGGSITIEQLIDIVQQDLTISGMLPKILPDKEIKRLIKEYALEWFYKNYQFALQKMYYILPLEILKSDVYNTYKYLILPEEIENVVEMRMIDNPHMWRIGIQAPYLSINLGVTNQPFLTSFVTTAGELAQYRSVISAFSDEINKLSLERVRFNYNHLNKRLNILGQIQKDMIIECWARIEEEELFDFEMFKKYVIGLSKKKTGELLGRFNFNMPGNFQYNSSDIISDGDKMIDEVKEQIKGETTTAWFKMSR